VDARLLGGDGHDAGHQPEHPSELDRRRRRWRATCA
jgi:hypothetical protein